MKYPVTRYAITALSLICIVAFTGCKIIPANQQGEDPATEGSNYVVTPAVIPGPTFTGMMPPPESSADVQKMPEFTKDEVDSAKAVVQEYFRAVELQDKQALLKTMTAWHDAPNMVYFEGETRKLIKIEYDPQDRMRRSYITHGRGSQNGADIENVIVFRVEFEVTYPDGKVTSAFNDGVYTGWNMILIREGAGEPWLIDDQGY